MISFKRLKKPQKSETRAQLEHRELCALKTDLMNLQQRWDNLIYNPNRKLMIRQSHNLQVAKCLNQVGELVDKYQEYAYDQALKAVSS